MQGGGAQPAWCLNAIKGLILFERTQRKTFEISLIPLINVIFLLVIFFLITGQIASNDGLQADLPISTTGDLQDSSGIVITVNNSSILINETVVPFENMAVFLAVNTEQEALERLVTIKADNNIDARIITKVIKILSRIGVKNVTIATVRG